MKRYTVTYLLFTLLLVLLASMVVSPIHAETKTPNFSNDAASVKSRLGNVTRLVFSSSGAERVRASGNGGAMARLQDAERILEEAETAYEAGDMRLAQEQLQRATESMFAAVRSVGTGSEGVSKKNRDFDARFESVDALLNAIERVAKEKGGLQGVQQRAQGLRGDAAKAKQLLASGRLDQARALLDTVYDETKTELEKLREGETLVRTLEFANPEEEYRYELDRNDTHQMLVKVLLEDKVKKAATRQRVDGFVTKSRALRARAEAEAGSGAYEHAVEILEQATRELQRAIRSAGVYIPG